MRNEAERVISFIETFCTLGHSYLGKPFILEEWQKDIIYDIYMPHESDPTKRARRSYVLGLPRKNGKSQLGAALAVYHLVADPYNSAPQVISAAGDRTQARFVFDEAARMIRANPFLAAECQVLRTEIRCKRTSGIYRAVSSDAGLQQGLNPSFVVFDELHIFKNNDLYTALSMGSATRTNPLMLTISTAGFDLETPLGVLYRTGLQRDGHILNGVRQTGPIEDKTFGMTWWGITQEMLASPELDLKSPALWESVNPAWSLMPDPLADFARPALENDFIRYRLNGWTTSATSFLPAGAWADLTDTNKMLIPGDTVVLGFDGSWKNDSTALVAVRVDDMYCEVIGHWEQPPNEPDWRVETSVVVDAIVDALRTYNVVELVCDPWEWQATLSDLIYEHNAPVVEFRTNQFSRMAPACNDFYREVMEGRLSHNGRSALGQHLANCSTKNTPAGIVITKESRGSARKIDLAVALIIAVQRALHYRAPVAAPSAGLIIL